MTDINELTPYGLSDAEYDEIGNYANGLGERLKEASSRKVKELTDSIHEEFHNYLCDWFESDTSSNFRELVRTRVNNILKGMLNSDWNKDCAEKFLIGYDFAQYRKDIYLAHKDIIQNKLIDELQERVKDLQEDLEIARRRY